MTMADARRPLVQRKTAGRLIIQFYDGACFM